MIRINFAEDFNEVLLAFARYKVYFLVVGGYAVNFYGHDEDALQKSFNSKKNTILKKQKALIPKG